MRVEQKKERRVSRSMVHRLVAGASFVFEIEIGVLWKWEVAWYDLEVVGGCVVSLESWE